MGILGRIMNGLRAFHRGYLAADPQQARRRLGDFDLYNRWEARQGRYDLFWNLYQNSAYADTASATAEQVKAAFRLSRTTEGDVNPVHRLVEFWACHLLGGPLDPAAGDGGKVKSALPILTDNDALRPALAKLWRDSRFAVEKGIVGRYGPCLGDVALKLVDDPDRRRVTLKTVHPGHLKWVERDDCGRVLGYMFEEIRFDPRHTNFDRLNPLTDPRAQHYAVTYSEMAYISPETGNVRYKTYLDGAPYDWRGVSGDGAELPPEWEAPYSWVPLVLIPHLPIGLDWGMSEVHALVAKVAAGDDLASGLRDQIRKVIRAPKLLSGIAELKDIKRPADGDPDRQATTIFLTGKENVGVYDLAAQLDIAAVGEHIDRLRQTWEADFPELRYYLQNAAGELSGRALRKAQEAITVKVQERRTTYDLGLADAFRLALAIGGLRGYPGYEAFGGVTDPHDEPRLELTIGHRAVFSADPLDESEEFAAEWGAIGAAVQTAGAPLPWVLEQRGYEPEQIESLAAALAEQQEQALAHAQDRMDLAGGGADEPDGDEGETGGDDDDGDEAGWSLAGFGVGGDEDEPDEDEADDDEADADEGEPDGDEADDDDDDDEGWSLAGWMKRGRS